MVGVWVFGGHLNSAVDFIATYKPILALPIFLLGIRSLRLASFLFSGYVFLTLVFYVILDWPHPLLQLSTGDWWLVISAALQLFAWRLDEMRKRVDSGRVIN
jgi:hypothetical protein